MLKTNDYQELLNLAYAGVIAQGGPSIDEDDTCLYKSPNGRRCAASLCLTDEAFDYAAEFEENSSHGTSIDKLAAEYGRDHPDEDDLGGAMLEFLGDLQAAHDELQYWNSEDWIKQWDRGINQLAKRYNITSPVK